MAFSLTLFSYRSAGVMLLTGVMALINCAPVFAQRVSSFDLASVRLQEGAFSTAQQTDLRYILALDVDRLLVPFLREAGIETDAKAYGNWESTGLDGHIGGHYLSALALMYASTGSEESKRRMDYMVTALARCQKANGNGYVGGIPGGRSMWEEIRNGKIVADNFSLNHKWVPLYNIHKIFAGLYDAHVIGKNEQAREVFISLCQWFHDLTASLNDVQFQQMLRSEHGGMNEVLAQAAELSGEEKFLTLAKKMSHQLILRPLLHGKDSLTGLHANTQIPKVIGFARIAELSNDASWMGGAKYFWETVVTNRSVSIGGNSVREHFHPSNDFSTMIESNQGPETCNTYNMLKLTKALFLASPEARYVDYYERALYNHILSSQHPTRGGFVYFTPMRPRHYRVYSNVHESFWCCVGSGIENHGKYGEMIYAHQGNDLFVNLFIASRLDWTEKGVKLHQQTGFPYDESSTIRLELKTAARFAIKIRHPSWSDGFRVLINGVASESKSSPGGYLTLDRKWRNGDVIEVRLPMRTTLEYLPDNSSWASFVHGPIVLAAAVDTTSLKGIVADDSRMGHVAEGKFYPVDEAPVILKKEVSMANEIRPLSGKKLRFEATSLIYPEEFNDLELRPFFEIHDARYMIYWLVATPEKLLEVKRGLAEKEAVAAALKAQTVDEVTFGEQQPEVEHRFKGASTEAGSSGGRSWRSTTEWLSVELLDPRSEARTLALTTISGWNRKFDLLLNDQLIQTVILPNSWDDKEVVRHVEIPDEVRKSSTGTLTFTIKPHAGAGTGQIHSVRLLR